jgi:uncharacterized protein YndB with AHSA1/START domain
MVTMMQDTIEREVTIRAAKERVFNAIVDPEQLTCWFPKAVQGKIEKGGEPVFSFGPGHDYQVNVIALDPHDYFAYRWATSPTGFVGDVLPHSNTLVEFRLQEVPEGTLVRIKESGFASLTVEDLEKVYADHIGGWEYMLPRLEALMTGGAVEENAQSPCQG